MRSNNRPRSSSVRKRPGDGTVNGHGFTCEIYNTAQYWELVELKGGDWDLRLHNKRKSWSWLRSQQVNVPKTRRTYCKGKDCRKHTQHKVTQYKAGKVDRIAESTSFSLTSLRHRCSRKESVVMTESNLVTVDRPSPFSTRRLRPQRRLFWDWSAHHARRRHNWRWRDASTSSLGMSLIIGGPELMETGLTIWQWWQEDKGCCVGILDVLRQSFFRLGAWNCWFALGMDWDGRAGEMALWHLRMSIAKSAITKF